MFDLGCLVRRKSCDFRDLVGVKSSRSVIHFWESFPVSARRLTWWVSSSPGKVRSICHRRFVVSPGSPVLPCRGRSVVKVAEPVISPTVLVPSNE